MSLDIISLKRGKHAVQMTLTSGRPNEEISDDPICIEMGRAFNAI